MPRGIFKRKMRLNKVCYFDDYCELVLEDNKGKEVNRTKIDLEDLGKIQTGKWSFQNGNKGYCIRIINTKTTLLHHIILGRSDGFEVDHINGDRMDNRKDNLRFVTSAQNKMNRSSKGIYKRHDNKKWCATIRINKKERYLGSFETPEEATRKRREAESFYFGDYARIL